MAPPEKPTESPSSAPPDAAEAAKERSKVFLEQLKVDVAGKSDEEKKTLVRERLSSLNKEQLEDLAAHVRATGEIVDAHVNILDLVDQQKTALRAQVEAQHQPEQTPSESSEPKSTWERMGDTVKNGAETVVGWFKSFGSWTSGKAGKGWQGFVAGLTSAISSIGSGLSWLREKSAQAFGSLAASMDDYLPDWLKKPLHMLMGDYGVLYKNFAKFKIEVQPNDPKGEVALQPFMDKFVGLSVDPNLTVMFDDFCKRVVSELRKDPVKGTAVPLKITQRELEQAADRVVAEIRKKPATPAPAPGTAPAAAAAPGAAPTGAPAAPLEVLKLDAIPAGTNFLGISRKVQLEGRTLTILASTDGTFQIDTVKYKLGVKKKIGIGWFSTTTTFSPSVSKLQWQPSGLECEGSFFVFDDKSVITREALEGFLRRHINGERKFENEKIVLEQIS